MKFSNFTAASYKLNTRWACFAHWAICGVTGYLQSRKGLLSLSYPDGAPQCDITVGKICDAAQQQHSWHVVLWCGPQFVSDFVICASTHHSCQKGQEHRCGRTGQNHKKLLIENAKKIPFILPKYINCWMPHQFTKRKFLYSRLIATWYVQWNLAHFSSGTQLMFYSKHGPPSNFPPTSKFSQDNFSCLPVPCKKCIFTCNMNMRWWRWMILQLCTGRQQKQTSYFPLRSNLF